VPVEIVDQLHGDVLVAAIYGETWTLGGAGDLLTYATVATQATCMALARY
jgi:hypothetical protein